MEPEHLGGKHFNHCTIPTNHSHQFMDFCSNLIGITPECNRGHYSWCQQQRCQDANDLVFFMLTCSQHWGHTTMYMSFKVLKEFKQECKLLLGVSQVSQESKNYSKCTFLGPKVRL